MAEEALKCTGCGRPRDESMADEDDAPDYVATPLKCWACETKEIAMLDAREANKGKSLAGWYWAVEERTRRNGHGG